MPSIDITRSGAALAEASGASDSKSSRNTFGRMYHRKAGL